MTSPSENQCHTLQTRIDYAPGTVIRMHAGSLWVVERRLDSSTLKLKRPNIFARLWWRFVARV